MGSTEAERQWAMEQGARQEWVEWWPSAGDQRVLGGRPGLCRLAEQEDRPVVSPALGSGVGVCLPRFCKRKSITTFNEPISVL